MYLTVGDWPNEYRQQDLLRLDELPLSMDSLDFSTQYELFGFINFMPGHYTAICKRRDGSWWKMDDTDPLNPQKLRDDYLVRPEFLCYINKRK